MNPLSPAYSTRRRRHYSSSSAHPPRSAPAPAARYGGSGFLTGYAAGSRYNLNQPPISPGSTSYYHQSGGGGGMGGSYYHGHQAGPPSVYQGGIGYGSRRGSMQSLIAASGMCFNMVTVSSSYLFTLLHLFSQYCRDYISH